MTWISAPRAALALGLVLTGCFQSVLPAPVSSPVGQRFEETGSTVALSVALPRFGGSVEVDGARRDVLPLPYVTLPALHMPIFQGRLPLGEACDLGMHAGVGRAGADARCGHRDGPWSVAGATAVSWVWFRGVEGETTLQLGVEDDGWLLYVSTGPGYSASYAWTVALDPQPTVSFEDLLGMHTQPGATRLVIAQADVSWNASLAWGVPLDRRLSLFMAYRFSYVFARTDASFRCEGCAADDPRRFSGFEPGYSVGVSIGLRGLGS